MGRWLGAFIAVADLVVRQALLSLRYNWGLALLSLLLAVSLWAFVADREDPERSDHVPGTVPVEVVNVPPDRAVYPPLQQSVSIRARAPESVFDDLTAADFRATVDLSGVSGDGGVVAIQVEELKSDVVATDWSPSSVTVHLAALTSRSVPVEIEELGTLPRGFALDGIDTDITEVTVTGPEPLVTDNIVVEGEVNLTGARASFEQEVPLRARDRQGTAIQGLTIEPQTVTVRVEIAQVEFTSPFIVRPIVQGTPAEGFRVTGIQIDPPIVSVTGPADVLQTIDAVAGIETEEVNIDGAQADVVRPVALRLPSDARTDTPQVTVRVSIGRVPAQNQGGGRP